MLTTIIIDDEKLALDYLEHILNDNENIEVIGSFQDSEQGMHAILNHNPDLIFLDIHMPNMSGIELAGKLVGKVDSKIIFITAHEKYALKAFEIGVYDYILKPIEPKRLEQLISRINHQNNQEKITSYSICTFKYFHIVVNETEIKNIKWRTSKAKELFIYLVQYSHEVVRKDILIDLLWPDLDVENAYDNLYTTIYHIRKTLEDIDLDVEIISSVHGYELNFNSVKYDVSEWLKGVERLNELLLKDGDKNELILSYKKIMKLYKGDYLAEETYVWKENEQERLRIIFIDTAKKMINYLMEKEEYTEAILLSLQLQDLYPYLDYSYFMLMKLYDKFGDMYNVERQYAKLQKVLKEEFNSRPSENIRLWYRDWIAQQHIS